MKSIFIDCNAQRAGVWQRVVRADDPPIDVNCMPFEQAELTGLLAEYEICIDDRSYLPTELIKQCDKLKHIVFLGTGAASCMNFAELALRSRSHYQGLWGRGSR